ncbi:putative DEAD/DEAH box helicase [Vibrio phage VaK]|uniref:Uncharacterized protein n=1 Tax=Vibrio anguillarum TaxID=55601 RepID=A0ABR9ZB44_VIBAN|nr:hypothetical protein H20_0006 [Vibrio phage H20]ARH11671.1 hypothetical protein pVa1_0006 [Vibrio phage pVa-1]ARH11766.1 putative DEAD/DEAH box helicase [Vibrio phage VaK]ARH11829.1 hypothetical protein pVa4_0005 [Vibrio phage pVa-4]MBF4375665.1 hypothetical protein [Vibrio anguillarum]
MIGAIEVATYNEEQAKEMESFGFNMINVSAFADDKPTFAIGFFDDEIKPEKIKSMSEKHKELMERYRNQRSENSINHTFDMEKGLSSVEMVTEDDIIGIVKSGVLGIDDVRELRKETLSDHCDKCKEKTKKWPEWKRKMAGTFFKVE